MIFAHPLPWSKLLAVSPHTIYKQDSRSFVWLVHDASLPGPLVIKRFDHNPLRQKLAWAIGTHPGQREADNARRLRKAGLPVVDVVGTYAQPVGFGRCKVHVATAYQGLSFQQLKRDGKLPSSQVEVETLLTAVGAIAADMLECGWIFRDFKTANIVVDEKYKPWLIDVGSAKRGKPCINGCGGQRAWRMLRMLDHTMTQDGWDAEARRNTLARALACLCPEPVDHAYDKLGRIVLK